MDNIVEVDVEFLTSEGDNAINIFYGDACKEGVQSSLANEDDDDDFVEAKKAKYAYSQSKKDSPKTKKASTSVPDGIQVPFDGDQYFVEKVLDYADSGANKDMYLVKWQGWDSCHNTWEPLENLKNCVDSLTEFYHKRKFEWEEIVKASTYIRMSDGKLRRQGPPKLAVPADPRPLAKIISEFRNLNTETLDSSAKEAAGEKYFTALRNGKSLLWEDRKTKKYLEKGFDGELDEDMNIELQTQIFYLRLTEKRKRTQEKLKDWERKLNIITRGKPKIIIENEADLASAPKDFIYSNAYVPGEGVTIPDEPPLGCSCSESSDCWTNRSKCCASGFGAENGYTKGKKVKEGVGIPLYECNSACKCDRKCPNRVVQDGYSTLSGYIMKIFRTFNGCGWGVKTIKAIPKGVFVGLYIGEIITTEEADKRGKKYDGEGRTYLFDLDFNSTTNPFTVDAKIYGNFTHFINHSCDANLGVYSVWVNCLDPNLPMLALFSLRDIAAGEEITMNYSNDLDSKRRGTESGLQECKCGTRKCRGYIF